MRDNMDKRENCAFVRTKKTNKYSTHLDLEKYRIFQYEKQSFKPQIKLRQISWLVLSKIFLFIIWKKIVLRFGRTNLLYRQFFAVSFHDILSESRNKMSNNFTFCPFPHWSTPNGIPTHAAPPRIQISGTDGGRRNATGGAFSFEIKLTQSIDTAANTASRRRYAMPDQSDPFGFARLKAGMLLFYMENAPLLNQDRIR